MHYWWVLAAFWLQTNFSVYTNQEFYELSMDEDGNDYIQLVCDEPQSILHFSENLYGEFVFSFQEKLFLVLDIKDGAQPNEFLITYQNTTTQQVEVAIFFYDKIVQMLFFTFQEKEYAFVFTERLSEFETQNTCN